ncbi:SlyX family protein [Moraxella nasovis]|uniref:SlyX family protein n=1 Tax=Moraxella nasovis TaxID=2904121 RepID=UPI001F6083E0|nr:SlyX family protein [Moraxella nasovis]UNU73151.1 SlyX family protein [Moraxella nasovis]
MNDIVELQIKLAYLEEMVESLNDVVTRQDRLLTDLQDQLKLMYGQLQNKENTITPFDLLADRPPHY